jgi:hypothetical protein
MSKIVRSRSIAAIGTLCAAAAFSMGGCQQAKDAAGGASGLCCTEFKVGADLSGVDWGVDATLTGKYKAFMQAVGDVSAAAAVSVSDVTAACQTMALDLGADKADPTVQGKAGAAAATAWCALAKGQIDAKFGASGTLAGQLTVAMTPPKCEASFEAKASCEASCSGSAQCDFKANPPKCTGGNLSVECSGNCTATAGVSMECSGSCSGGCSGSCQATGTPVACQGQCDGTCAAGTTATDNGIQADGSCKGTCSGTCTMGSGVKVTCSGACQGTCDATCKATGTVKARCSGTCDADISAPKCEGGTMEGGCTASAECSGSCSGSAQAKANCTPPSIALGYTLKAGLTAEQQVQAALALESIRVNLPKLLLVLKARGDAFTKAITGVVTVGGSIVTSGDPGKLGLKGVACGAIAVAATSDAVANFGAALSASTSVVGSFTLQ